MKKKIASLLLAVTIILSMGVVSVFAASGTITIQPPPNMSTDGITYYAYKIFDVTSSGSSYAYTVVTPFDTFGNNAADDPAGILTSGQTLKDFLSGIPASPTAAQMQQMNTLANELYAFAVANSVTAAGSATGAGGPVTINNLDNGYYVVYAKGTSTANGVTVVAQCALTTADPDVTIDLKADVPTIDKTVSDDPGNTYGKTTDLNVGDTAYFKITSTVPKMTGYKAYQFILHDTMSVGLTYDDHVSVTLNGTPLVENTDYKVLTTGLTPATETLQIVFAPSKFVTYTPGSAIVITYQGILNSSAVIGGSGNPNSAFLSFSNNPSNQYIPTPGDDFTPDNPPDNPPGTGDTPPSVTTVYTYDIPIYKTDDKGVALSGASFAVFSTLADAAAAAADPTGTGNLDNALKFTAKADTTTNPLASGKIFKNYIYDSKSGTINIMAVSSDGYLDLQGLDAGTYYLAETATHDGFNRLTEPITVTIVPHSPPDGTFTLTVGSNVNLPKVTVVNSAGSIFPSTGGIGRSIFYVGGFALIGCAVIFLAGRKKFVKTSKAGK